LSPLGISIQQQTSSFQELFLDICLVDSKAGERHCFELSADVFSHILSFVPDFPNYFTLRRVNSTWNRMLAIGGRVFMMTETLDLLEHDEHSSCSFRNFLDK
jgi:hypothetical protein